MIYFLAFFALLTFPSCGTNNTPLDQEYIGIWDLIDNDVHRRKSAQKYYKENWKDAYTIQVVELLYLSNDRGVTQSLLSLLKSGTGQDFGRNMNEWYAWIWRREEMITSDYGNFKGKLYEQIDPKFNAYFTGRTSQAHIRLDEIRWGGVVQDGIPPLRNPKMIKARDADYLEDDHIVFGIEVNGDVRAYPKRILAWHEMFVDEVGGEHVAGVYCTLCGTVILYNTVHHGVKYHFGTSGFLYRSNKLMYDQKTQSLWNTLLGKPVVGPLIDLDIELISMSVVTTTWGEWRRRHPKTRVLSLDTGHRRYYSEGAAYKKYFATDQLMFNVPKTDDRLHNKDEVLIVRANGYELDPLAISIDYLSNKPIYKNKVSETPFVVLTDKSGANRVFESQNIDFIAYDQKDKVIEENGHVWIMTEQSLINQSDGSVLNRLPYHRAFWFGWYALYPETRLVK